MRLIKILFLYLLPTMAMAQDSSWEKWDYQQFDSMQWAWRRSNNDTIRLALARSLGIYFQRCKETVVCTRVGEVSLKNKANPVVIYDVRD